jgi:hypothetical protein
VKWVIFAVALVAIFPFSQWLRRNPGEAPKVWMCLGFLPFGLTALPALNISVISWPEWPGYVKGLQFSALDACTLAIYLALPRSKHALPFRVSMGLYFAAVVFSIFQAQAPEAAVFYAWQLARMFLLYAVVVKACVDERVPSAILTGMAIGLCIQAVAVIWQRFGLGVIQATGTFGHQNSLGLASHFAVFPLFALLLAGQQGWQSIIVPAAGAIVAVLTASRATLGLNAAGLFLVFSFSAMRRWSSRKAKVMLLGAAVVVGLTPIALSSYEHRFAAVPLSEDYDERAAFERAASMVLSDHPLGIGANNYVVAANTGGYMDRAGVTWTSRSTSVHNAYWLTAAELGYFGLFAYIALLARLTTMAFAAGWRNRNDPRGDLLLGLGVSMLMMSIHSYFEWIIFVAPIQYLFALNAGLIGGLVSQPAYQESRTQPSYLRAGGERIGSNIPIENNDLRVNKSG